MSDSRPHVRDITTAEFAEAVLQRSREVPVVVDFWAEWCGPCRVLGPLLERLADEYGGAFELVKVDVDQNPELAGQFGVQGIPTVVGFRDGAPASRFTGALPERQLRDWLDALVPSEVDRMVDEARGAALAGDVERAENLYREVLTSQPDHLEAGTGLAALEIAAGRTDEALTILERLSPTAEVERLKSAARLTEAQGTDIDELRAKVEADPADDRAKIDLAVALAARGEFEPALDLLLKVVRNKGELMDEARRAMLDIFGILGDTHPLTVSYRRQLASALF